MHTYFIRNFKINIRDVTKSLLSSELFSVEGSIKNFTCISVVKFMQLMQYFNFADQPCCRS